MSLGQQRFWQVTATETNLCPSFGSSTHVSEWIPEGPLAYVFELAENKLKMSPQVAWYYLYISMAMSSGQGPKQGINFPSSSTQSHFCKPGSMPTFTTRSMTSACSLAWMYRASWPDPLAWLLKGMCDRDRVQSQ